jgi:hypothetical protein
MLCALRYWNTFRNLQEARCVVIYFSICFAVVGINAVKKTDELRLQINTLYVMKEIIFKITGGKMWLKL